MWRGERKGFVRGLLLALFQIPLFTRRRPSKVSLLTGIGVPRRYKERVLISLEFGEVGVRSWCQEV